MLNRIVLDPTHHGNVVASFNHQFSIVKRPPDLNLLEQILTHFSNIPYENLSKIIKLKKHWGQSSIIRLPEEVMEGHIVSKLGGTCFSLTFLLQTILTNHGYSCYPVMADMRRGKNEHCALIVQLQGTHYLVDPGYLLNQPMAIDKDHPRLYKTDISGIELVSHPEIGSFDLYTFDSNGRKWRYRFMDRPVSHDEFLSHWLSSFYWQSMHGICLTKFEEDKMIYIHQTFMRETDSWGKRNFNIKHSMHATIQRIFGIDPEWVEEALAALETNMEYERKMGLWRPKGGHTA